MAAIQMEGFSKRNAADPTCAAEWFRRRACLSPERPALTFEGQTWSYGEMQRRIGRMSGVLKKGGVGIGDRVAYIGFNHSEVLVMFFAAACIGAIFVPLNFRLAIPELISIIVDAKPHTLIADEHHAPIVDRARDLLTCKRYLCLGPAIVGWEAINRTVAEEATIPAPAATYPDDVVLLLYTSGTTGKPKGAKINNGNIWASNVATVLANEFNSRDVALNSAPLFHAAGLCSISLPTLMAGGHLILQRRFDAREYLCGLEQYRVTLSIMVPAMMLFVSQQNDFESANLSALRLLSTGGAPVPEHLLRTYNARGIPVSQSYGLTESTSAATILQTDYSCAKLGSCGRASLMVDIRLVDGEGRVIAQPYVRGEICLRGPSIAMGYWNRPLETAELFDQEGWLRTGDGGYFDDEDFYYICDRIKDMIISGGENVYPSEVENVLCEHVAITEVAVIGGPDERWGERVIAIAALKLGASLSLEELVAFAQDRLARYKLPRELHLVEAMPRTTTGKIIKSELRHQFASRI
ncbi:MAG: long-chain-fatty-acid--CoA ligase [Caballeronia mineralivorans]|jgi:fatty-acyl-CoA synthase|nr:long-chain-fatty-acid--CoA ligase [Caballeronia mineralivorans]